MFYPLIKSWQPFAAVIVIAIFWSWESFRPFLKIPYPRVKHGLINVIISLINGVLITFVFSGVTVLAADYSIVNSFGMLYNLSLPEILQWIAAFILLDAWNYWWHRINHLVPFFWRFHRMHHSDPNMDVTTATRFHFGEIIISSIIRLPVIFFIGIPIWTLIIYDFILLLNTLFHHSNISISKPADKKLRYFIVSPFMHKVHHSRIQSETDSNYSSFCTLWDRIFGSYRERDDYENIKFGLDNFYSEDDQSLTGLIKTPLFKK